MDDEKKWFITALESLNKEILIHGSVDGASFLLDFLNKNWPEDLDDSIDEEEFERYVNDNVDKFEVWLLKLDKQLIFVGDDYTWSHTKPIESSSSCINGNPELDTSLTDKNLEELKDSDFFELCKQRDFLILHGNIHKAEEAALKTAKLADKNQHIDVSERVSSWEIYGNIRQKQDEEDAYLHFEKAGNIALSNGARLNAANLFSKAAEIYKGDDWKIKHHLLRQARVLFSDSGVNDKASKIYIKECDLKRENSDSREAIKGRFYSLLSNYGESPFRVLFCISIVIVLCAFLYWVVDINTPGQGIFECNNSQHNKVSFTCKEVAGEQASLPTHFYFSFVTFTTLGYGDYSPTVGWARVIASIEAFLGLILSSLFIATFLRKFSR